jgi:hypothetical protein
MEANTRAAKLEQAIVLLEEKQRSQFKDLKNEFTAFSNELKPSNLIENVITSLKFNPSTKSTLVNSALSLVSGYISGKLINNSSNSIFKKIAGYGLQYVLTNFIGKK